MSARLSYQARIETTMAPLAEAKAMHERGEMDETTLGFLCLTTWRELEEIRRDAELDLVP